MITTCGSCGATLPSTSDAFCSECRCPLDEITAHAAQEGKVDGDGALPNGNRALASLADWLTAGLRGLPDPQQGRLHPHRPQLRAGLRDWLVDRERPGRQAVADRRSLSQRAGSGLPARLPHRPLAVAGPRRQVPLPPYLGLRIDLVGAWGNGGGASRLTFRVSDRSLVGANKVILSRP